VDAVTDALAYYGAALRRAATGHDGDLHLVDAASGWLRRLALSDWSAALRPGDEGLLARCAGATLDVGCGPGRLAAALTGTGLPVLGIDISAEAVRQARRRGAPAQRADVFDAVPGEGRWRHVLLADGNIGIGGDPVRLLRRCRRLLCAGGDVVLELDPPGSGSWQGPVRLRHGGRTSRPFPWAAVAADDLRRLADASGARVLESWTEQGRWFARLCCG
jgi:SAM-dependent methyltransferase